MAKRSSRKQSAGRKTGGRKTAARKSTGRKTVRKTARKTARKAARKTAPRKATRKRAPAKRTAGRKTTTRVARAKNAARAAASRSTRREPKPKEPSRLQSATTAVKGAVASAVAAVAKRLPGARSDMDAITLLMNDHRRFEELLKQGEETTERAVKGRTDLLETITVELGVHELIEEKLLYPALKKFPEARDIVLEGFEEHHVADLILKELHEVAKDDEQWGAKFKVLKESIEHHIQEEEGDMFRKARGVMSQEDLAALGREMAQMKRDAEKGRPI